MYKHHKRRYGACPVGLNVTCHFAVSRGIFATRWLGRLSENAHAVRRCDRQDSRGSMRPHSSPSCPVKDGKRHIQTPVQSAVGSEHSTRRSGRAASILGSFRGTGDWQGRVEAFTCLTYPNHSSGQLLPHSQHSSMVIASQKQAISYFLVMAAVGYLARADTCRGSEDEQVWRTPSNSTGSEIQTTSRVPR